MERRKQIFELLRRFDKDFETALSGLNVEEQLIVTSFFRKVIPIFRERAEGYYDEFYAMYEKEILEQLRAKAKPIYNLQLTDYLVQDSMKLVHVQHDLKVKDDDQFLSDEELDDFLTKVSRNINLKHQMLLLVDPERKSTKRKTNIQGLEQNEQVESVRGSASEEKPIPSGNHEEYMSIEECAKFLGVSKVTIHAYKGQGMPHYKMGRTVKFKKSEVLNFMKQKEKPIRKKK